jgi:excisionase family DNA binding protein
MFHAGTGGSVMVDSGSSESLLSPAEAAEFLGVSKRFVYTLVKEGKLRRVQVGKRTRRFRRADLVAYVEAHLS